MIHFLCRSKSKQNKEAKSLFSRNCFQPIVKPNLKKPCTFLFFARARTHPRFEYLSSRHLSSLLVGKKTHKCPFVVYAILEAINAASTQISRVKNRTRETERQYASSFGAVLIDSRSWLFYQKTRLLHLSFKFFCQLQEKALSSCSFPVFVLANGIANQSFYRGEECIAKLFNTVLDWVLWCYNEKQIFRLLRMFQQQRIRMLNVSTVLCCICGKDVERAARVIHHCHPSGTLFGVAHL